MVAARTGRKLESGAVGNDVRAFCDTLGIADAIVLGVSFGGIVALAYATRHPTHPLRLVLISAEAVGGSPCGFV
jgi:proline iminopeptidase